LLAALSVGVVAADTEGGHTGSPGSHALRDRYVSTAKYQSGARCTYDEGGSFREILVRPPTVFARNTTSAQEFQVVGWRPRLQKLGSSGLWGGYRNGAYERAVATDASSAGFSAQAFASGGAGFPIGRYRVVVDMQWFSASATESTGTGTVLGTATHIVDTYTDKESSLDGMDFYMAQRYYCEARP
jgi:hypothetical protein